MSIQMGLRAYMSCVLAYLGSMLVLGLAADFQTGRASHYVYNNGGSCSYGPIFASESLGDPLHILAIADCSSLYANSCGTCFEVKCRNAVIKDDNGVQLDRTEACYDEESSVILRTADACPSFYPANQESNSRWCRCQYDQEHFDISSEAFSQLADVGIGVIGTSWRQVDCDAKPEQPAKVRDTTRYANALPSESENQHRTQTDWTEFVASWVTVQELQPLNPLQVNPPNIFSTIFGNLLRGWVLSDVKTGNAVDLNEPSELDVPVQPVSTGRGGEGSPACFWRDFGHGIGFSSNESTGTNTTIVTFWVFTDNAETVDMHVTIGQNNTNVTCDYIDLAAVPAISQNNGWISYNLFVPSFNTTSDSKVFEGCNGHPASDFNALYFLNSALESKWICIDDLLWR